MHSVPVNDEEEARENLVNLRADDVEGRCTLRSTGGPGVWSGQYTAAAKYNSITWLSTVEMTRTIRDR